VSLYGVAHKLNLAGHKGFAIHSKILSIPKEWSISLAQYKHWVQVSIYRQPPELNTLKLCVENNLSLAFPKKMSWTFFPVVSTIQYIMINYYAFIKHVYGSPWA
jgi:hypothetical protein